jgi:hypothetical protein
MPSGSRYDFDLVQAASRKRLTLPTEHLGNELPGGVNRLQAHRAIRRRAPRRLACDACCSMIASHVVCLLALGVLLAGDARAAEEAAAEQGPPAELPASAGKTNDESVDPTKQHRWHLPRKGAHRVPRDAVEADPSDWNPLAQPAARGKRWLKRARVTLDVDTAFVYQYASEVRSGTDSAGTFAWRVAGDWEAIGSERMGTAYLAWNALGTAGLNYDPAIETLSGNIGAISDVNGNVYPDGGALDEVYGKYVAPGGRFLFFPGRIDLSSHFDTNAVANDGFSQFLPFALTNNPSIPWPLYGGIGGLFRLNLTPWLALMVGAGDSSSDEPIAAWKTVGDGSWMELVELDAHIRVPRLGEGNYRLTPWHNRLSGEDGWGVGFNFDQALVISGLVSFFRFGIGAPDVTPVETFVSGGVAWEGLFGRTGDWFGVGAAWSEPGTGAGVRNETLLDVAYTLALTHSLELTPDLQLVFNPADAPSARTVVVPGVRMLLKF